MPEGFEIHVECVDRAKLLYKVSTKQEGRITKIGYWAGHDTVREAIDKIVSERLLALQNGW